MFGCLQPLKYKVKRQSARAVFPHCATRLPVPTELTLPQKRLICHHARLNISKTYHIYVRLFNLIDLFPLRYFRNLLIITLFVLFLSFVICFPGGGVFYFEAAIKKCKQANITFDEWINEWQTNSCSSVEETVVV